MIDAIKFVLYDRREGISRKLERTPTFTYVIYAHIRARTRTQTRIPDTRGTEIENFAERRVEKRDTDAGKVELHGAADKGNTRRKHLVNVCVCRHHEPAGQPGLVLHRQHSSTQASSTAANNT